MAVNVNTNVSAMTAQRYLNNANSATSENQSRNVIFLIFFLKLLNLVSLIEVTLRELLGFPRRRKPLHRKINWRNHHGSECKH